MSTASPLFLCLTTVSNPDDAERLAEKLIDGQLAACVHVDSPVKSLYRWQGKVEQDIEYRLSIFAVAENLDRLQAFIEKNHPYDTPKWVCFQAEKVSEKYLKWANEMSNVRGFI